MQPRSCWFGVLLAGALVMLFGPACTTSDPVLGPEASLLPESHGIGACMQECFNYAETRMSAERKRFTEAVKLWGGDSEILLAEQSLHKDIRAEIRAELKACQRGCPVHRKGR